jgi:hypothetical protein
VDLNFRDPSLWHTRILTTAPIPTWAQAREWTLLRSRCACKSRVNVGISNGSRRASKIEDWLVERTGFEPPRPFDFAVVQRGVNPSGNELAALLA